jgi:hypothetical protein
MTAKVFGNVTEYLRLFQSVKAVLRVDNHVQSA